MTSDGPAAADPLRARLVAAAAEVFSEKGYDGARVQEIARRAGVTTGAIYGRFSGKDELLLEAIDAHSDLELEALFGEEALRRGTDVLASMGVHLLDRERTGQALLLEAIVAGRRDPEFGALVRERIEEMARRLARLVEDGKREGTVDPDLDTDAVVRFAHAVGLGFLLYEALDVALPGSQPWAALIERMVGALAADRSGGRGTEPPPPAP